MAVFSIVVDIKFAPCDGVERDVHFGGEFLGLLAIADLEVVEEVLVDLAPGVGDGLLLGAVHDDGVGEGEEDAVVAGGVGEVLDSDVVVYHWHRFVVRKDPVVHQRLVTLLRQRDELLPPRVADPGHVDTLETLQGHIGVLLLLESDFVGEFDVLLEIGV